MFRVASARVAVTARVIAVGQSGLQADDRLFLRQILVVGQRQLVALEPDDAHGAASVWTDAALVATLPQ